MPFSDLFRPKSPPLLGLDISSSAVKLVELGKAGDRLRVESYSIEPLPPNAVVEKNISDIEAVGESIKRAVKHSGTHCKHAAAAVAGSAVITKIIAMPANLTQEELEQQIELEADQYIPYPLDEVNLDFEVIGPTENDPERIDVLLAASKSENVDLRVAAIEMAGLKARVIDVEAYAMENAFALIAPMLPLLGMSQTVAMVDVGATTTTLNILHDRQRVYTREQPFGGRQLTEEIQHHYGLSYEEAGQAKRHGGLPDNYASEVLEPFKEAMAQEVGRALQIFFSSSTYNNVDYIVLTGGSAMLEGMDGSMSRLLGIPTMIANPFRNMLIASRVNNEALARDTTSLMLACGLALRSFD